MKKFIRIFALLVLALGVLLAVAFQASAPAPPPADSESARRLAAGPLPVAAVDRTFVDRSRATDARSSPSTSPSRRAAKTRSRAI